MSNQTITMTDTLYEYMLSVSLREADILARLREETANHPLAEMQISPEQGQFMSMISDLMGATKYIEVGTFTGYSSLAMALAMGAGAELICCDISEDFTNIAKRYWAEAGVDDRITLHLGHATETLDMLLDEGQAGDFDIMFIDADKINYEEYFERGMALVRTGGLIAIDNVLWSGAVADPADTEPDTRAIRAINTRLHTDNRVGLSLIPIGDGLTLARKL